MVPHAVPFRIKNEINDYVIQFYINKVIIFKVIIVYFYHLLCLVKNGIMYHLNVVLSFNYLTGKHSPGVPGFATRRKTCFHASTFNWRLTIGSYCCFNSWCCLFLTWSFRQANCTHICFVLIFKIFDFDI